MNIILKTNYQEFSTHFLVLENQDIFRIFSLELMNANFEVNFAQDQRRLFLFTNMFGNMVSF